MAFSALFSANITSLSSSKLVNSLSLFPPHLPSSYHHNPSRRYLPLPASSISSASFPPFIDVEYLESEFSGRGVTFTGFGQSYVARMAVENGSVATVMLPSGIITSYKPKMWHGGTEEVLHTFVSKGDDGGAFILGGVSLALACESEGGGFLWSPTTWTLSDVRGSPRDSIEVEIISRDSKSTVEVKYSIILREDVLSSKITVSSSSSALLQLIGSFLSHLTVSTPDATYAIGLEGSDFINRPPLLSEFSIIPPELRQRKETGSSQFQVPSLKGLSPASDGKMNNYRGGELEEEMEGEERYDYKHLTEKMSRIYRSAPRNFTIIDRGRRNSVVVGRNGFEELYIYSPGSSYEWYGKYAYVCVGQSAVLKPIILGPAAVWTGEQQLHNPNL
ncbi:hypothetical protein Nepgr_020596 [Nepenthes gracilis]|uniref:NDH-dependent cyclic electron flow 5 n=1 Tax=Nepenthes gracilis TaxID=150966 RepID=A0AAD3SVK8_NEPGR|nr:hypothetical protein Nepgr_020596 [Nepenthes gracilis]